MSSYSRYPKETTTNPRYDKMITFFILQTLSNKGRDAISIRGKYDRTQTQETPLYDKYFVELYIIFMWVPIHA